MALIATVFSSAPETQADIEIPRILVLFCGIGLAVSLLLATNGLDMSVGFL